MDDDCKDLRGNLSRAKANLLVVRTRLYSIEGLFSNGIVARTTDREARLQKEKESIVMASVRMHDQKMEVQGTLNETAERVAQLETQLKQEHLSKMYTDGVIAQMKREINGTEAKTYVRMAIRFQPKLSPTSNEFKTHVTVALALAFNTTEDRIQIDLIQDLSLTMAAGVALRGRRLLSNVRQQVHEQVHEQVHDVLVHVRVVAEAESLEGVARTVRLATSVGGKLEQMLLQEGVGLGVKVMGEIQAVVRGENVH